MARTIRRAALTALAVSAGAACIPVAVFNGPEVLAAGRTVGGPATSMVETISGGGDVPAGGLELAVRHGIGHGMDVGLRASGIPPLGTLYGDLRWQFQESPVPMTAGLGGSFTALNVDEEPGDTSATGAFGAVYPSVAIGTDRLWTAVRGVVLFGAPTRVLADEAFVGVHVGTSFGDELRILPVAFIYAGVRPMAGLGLALQQGTEDP